MTTAIASLGDVLRRARARAGLSQRQLAERMGVSWAAVGQAERGAEPRHSTLVEYLEALPDLQPHEVLGRPPRGGAATPDEAWEHYRRVFGFEADEVRKRVRIAENGDAATTIETRGLRWHRREPRELRLLLGAATSVIQEHGAELTAIREQGSGVTTRRVGSAAGRSIRQFRFPAERLRAGASFTRRVGSPGLFKLWNEDAVAAHGPLAPFVGGTSLAVGYPIGLAVVSLQFPADYRPADVAAVVWPTNEVPDADVPDRAAAIDANGFGLDVSRSGRTVTLRAERPLVGFKYGISWEFPWRADC